MKWYSLVDLAAADRGIIPNDIMENEELVKELPAFFRTLRGKSLLNKTCRMSSAKSRKVTDAEQSGAFQNSIYFKRRLLEVPTKQRKSMAFGKMSCA